MIEKIDASLTRILCHDATSTSTNINDNRGVQVRV